MAHAAKGRGAAGAQGCGQEAQGSGRQVATGQGGRLGWPPLARPCTARPRSCKRMGEAQERCHGPLIAPEGHALANGGLMVVRKVELAPRSPGPAGSRPLRPARPEQAAGALAGGRPGQEGRGSDRAHWAAAVSLKMGAKVWRRAEALRAQIFA